MNRRGQQKRMCAWCPRPNRAEPALLVHRRSGHQEQISLCRACTGGDSTLWLQWRLPDQREAVA